MGGMPRNQQFKRSKAGFALTESGFRLLKHAEGMEHQASLIADSIGIENSDVGGAVRLASMEGIGSMYLTRCLRDFSQLYPSVQVNLITDTRLLDLSRREADVFVNFSKPQGRRLWSRKVGEFRVALYASKAYGKEHSLPKSRQDLDKHPFIDFIDDHVHIKENLWLSDIIRPRHVAFRSTSLIAQYHAVLNGQGIAMLPSFVVENSKDLQPILPELFTMRDIWLSIHEDLLHVSSIKVITRFLESRFQADREMLTELVETR
jgi:DNA-binding transcriptional LysR family regulator